MFNAFFESNYYLFWDIIVNLTKHLSLTVYCIRYTFEKLAKANLTSAK